MSAKDAHLYGASKAKKAAGKEISSSSSLAFSSQLTSLIAGSKQQAKERPAHGRQRPKKEDIFSVHNKNAKKRALKDLDDISLEQKHSTSSEPIDQATWHRAKRKMEEKARLYSAMKRGDIEDLDEKYAVDFDRKWAEAQDKDEDVTESSEEDDMHSDGEELVEYVDEFGRNRTGTRAQAAREERKRQTKAADASDRFVARPSMPTNVIFGDTIQSAAFNPDDSTTHQMAEIAAKRDHETPPPDEHFDSKKEIRSKGVGFFQFSADSNERKKQMENLDAERKETETRRAEAAARKEHRRREIEERRRKLQEKRTNEQTDQFLSDLTGELEGKVDSSAKEADLT